MRKQLQAQSTAWKALHAAGDSSERHLALHVSSTPEEFRNIRTWRREGKEQQQSISYRAGAKNWGCRAHLDHYAACTPHILPGCVGLAEGGLGAFYKAVRHVCHAHVGSLQPCKYA